MTNRFAQLAQLAGFPTPASVTDEGHTPTAGGPTTAELIEGDGGERLYDDGPDVAPITDSPRPALSDELSVLPHGARRAADTGPPSMWTAVAIRVTPSDAAAPAIPVRALGAVGPGIVRRVLLVLESPALGTVRVAPSALDIPPTSPVIPGAGGFVLTQGDGPVELFTQGELYLAGSAAYVASLWVETSPAPVARAVES